VHPELAFDVVKRYQSDAARLDAVEELRDQAEGTDAERRTRLKHMADAIEAMCASSEERVGINIVTNDNLAWHEARRRFEIIEAQIDAVCPPDEDLNEDAEWILEANIDHLLNKTDKTESDKVLLMFLKQFDIEMDGPVEYKQHKRTGANPWETDSGGKIKSTGRSNDVLDYGARDYTKAGKKERAKALPSVRRLDPTTTPIAPPKPRDKARALGWGRFDDGDRPTKLDNEGNDRKRKAEERRINEYARHARRERRLGIGKK
jgi:hypothetical protein